MKNREVFDQRKLKKPWLVPNFQGTLEAMNIYFSRQYKTEYALIYNALPDILECGTRFGIEIECEGMPNAAATFTLSSHWAYKPDGSLRNGGAEFVSPALQAKDIRSALASIYAWMGSNPEIPAFSWRTSIHVHLDCMGMSVNEFRTFLLLYMIFEDSLFQFANPGRRETNIFCTPISRGYFYALARFLQAKRPEELQSAYATIAATVQKYSALNLLHMYDFGTVEFRHLRGTNDPKFIAQWISLLARLYQVSKELSPDALLQMVSTLNTTSVYDHFTTTIFGQELAPLLTTRFSAGFLSRGISVAKEIIYGKEFASKIKYSNTGGLAKFIALKQKQGKKDRLASRKPKGNVSVSAITIEEAIAAASAVTGLPAPF